MGEMPISRHARITRTAISPRLATSSFLNTALMLRVSLVLAGADMPRAWLTTLTPQPPLTGQQEGARGVGRTFQRACLSPRWTLASQRRHSRAQTGPLAGFGELLSFDRKQTMRAALAQTPFVVVDLETTGGSARFDRVLEIAAIRVQNGVVQDR